MSGVGSQIPDAELVSNVYASWKAAPCPEGQKAKAVYSSRNVYHGRVTQPALAKEPVVIYLCTYDSPVGTLTLASDGPHLCGLWLDGQKYFEEKLALRVTGQVATDMKVIEGPDALAASPALQAAVAWLDVYFTGRDPGALPPISLHGTPFQEEVWDQIAKISYGRLTTYGAIAKAIAEERGDGSTVSARAVGVAVGRNPCSIIVPCHRVVGSAGSLTGYSGGIDRKVRLLQLEGVDTTKLRVPMRGTAL